ncbi:MAG: hypothetical protein Kow0042_31160 [Calditrichia bacterium]
MTRFKLKPAALAGIALAVGVLVVLLEYFISLNQDGTLLLTLTFWVALVQGSVALVAAAEASGGKWIQPLKKDLLSFYPLILLIALLSLFLGLHMDAYAWSEHPGKWLNSSFFLIRNFVIQILAFIVAHFFVRATLNGRESKNTWAVLYLFIFVVSQSLVAFDWVMSLEYPWISTLFGGIFFMEAFFTGLALLSIVSAYFLRKGWGNKADITKVLRDAATFMFGFALAWAGLFYAQYLVIWYGNIPFETNFFVKRLSQPSFHGLFYLHVLFLFIIPFVGLLSNKWKTSPTWVTLMAVVVLLGVLVERLYYLLPVTQVSVGKLIVEFILMGFIFWVFFRSRERFLGASP